jgi:hypothetical protein
MGTLWIVLFKAPWLFGNNEAVAEGFFFALLLPGILVFVVAMFTTNIHNLWTGYFVLGAIFNWLLYSQLVYALIRLRRRKREAGLPPPEPERFNYADDWQKPGPRSEL